MFSAKTFVLFHLGTDINEPEVNGKRSNVQFTYKWIKQSMNLFE